MECSPGVTLTPNNASEILIILSLVTFSPSTDLQDVTATEEGTHKILQNGQVKIVHEGEQYSIKGEKL